LKFFDSHLHIIDSQFPLVSNQGYRPETFSVADYLNRVKHHQLVGGAVVSGSFQAFDQSYLIEALNRLGPNFVGVTQLPERVSDNELIELNQSGVRALRFNVKRGGSEQIQNLERFAKRVYEINGWHVELYIDSRQLDEYYRRIVSLPLVSIDHLGLSKGGFKTVLKLVEKGVKIKATGFGRLDFDVKQALSELNSANPEALMFGTDLPSTRAPRPFVERDINLIIEAVGEIQAKRIFYRNANEFYKRC